MSWPVKSIAWCRLRQNLLVLFSWIFFPGKFYLKEILRGCRQAMILLAWKGTQGIGGSSTTVVGLEGGVCCPLKVTLCAKHEGVAPLRQTFCK